MQLSSSVFGKQIDESVFDHILDGSQAQQYREWRDAEEMKGVTWRPQLSRKVLSSKEDSDCLEPRWMSLSRLPTSSSRASSVYCFC